MPLQTACLLDNHCCAYLHLLQAGKLLLPVTGATLYSAMQCLQINLLLLYTLL